MHRPADAPSSSSGRTPAGGEREAPRTEQTVISASAAPPASTADIGKALEGTQLGPYQLDRFVGGGGMGAVFRAVDTTLDRIVAVKVLSRQQSSDEEMLRRFRNEAQSAARLDHENIGRVHAVGSEAGWHYIVFEFIEGTNLRDLVRAGGPLEIGRVVDIAIQIADALEHASQRDVVHRDIKPSNIVMTPTGRARLVDMGLARLPHVGDAQDLTVSGMTLGTFDYISPEQARDPRAADVRSDLYSLGCTIFFMLTGRPPFADGTMVQKLLHHQQDPPPAIESLRPDVPRRLAAILGRLMEKDPADRYQRPAVLAADLLAFADEQRIDLGGQRPVVVTVPGPHGRSGPLPWLLPLLALAALVLGLWLKSFYDRRGYRAAGNLARPTAAGSVLRVGNPGADGKAYPTLAAAVEAAGDGDIVELAYDGAQETASLATVGKRLAVRAAPGRSPVVRIASAAAGARAGWVVENGALAIRGVRLELAEPPADVEPMVLFAVRSGTLACEESLLVMPGDPLAAANDSREPRAAFVDVGFATGTGAGGSAVWMREAWASGDAAFLLAEQSVAGRITLEWSGGGFAAPRQLIVADGVQESDAGGDLTIDCRLERAQFACRDGLVLLKDSPLHPRPPRLEGLATASRFLCREAPLIAQFGLADQDILLGAVTWADRGSGYEGTDVFRRIEGAGELDLRMFSDEPQPLRHSLEVAGWPDPTVWRAGPTAKPESGVSPETPPPGGSRP
jgi:serine/threonine protein kinase